MRFIEKVHKHQASIKAKRQTLAKHDDKAYEKHGGTKVTVKEGAGSDAVWIEDGTGAEHYDHNAKLARDYWGDDFTGTHFISDDDAYTLFSEG